MRRHNHLLAFFCLTLALLGCGDTPPVVFRDAITTWNELADTVAEIPDDPETAEEVAGTLVKTRLDVLEKKWKEVQKRVGKIQKGEKEERESGNETIKDMKDNAEFTMGRLATQFGGSVNNLAPVEGRLRKIIAKVHQAKPGQATPNLDKCLTMVSGFGLTLPSEAKKFPNAERYKGSWTFSGFGTSAGGGGGMRGGAPGMPGGPPGMPGPPGMRPPGP